MTTIDVIKWVTWLMCILLARNYLDLLSLTLKVESWSVSLNISEWRILSGVLIYSCIEGSNGEISF